MDSAADAVPGGRPTRILLRNIADGDRESFACLYDLTAPRVYALILRILGNPNLAAEATLAAYHQVWLTANQYVSDGAGADCWVMAIAHRTAANAARNRRTIAPARPGIRRRTHRSPRPLAALSAAERDAVTLAYFGCLSTAEIAARAGDTVPVTHARLRDGLNDLRAAAALDPSETD